jgi:MFS family permease
MTSALAHPASSRDARHVWVIVAVLFACTFVVQGMALGGIVVFDDRMLAALGTTRGAFKFRDLVYMLATSTSCLGMAWLVEKLGVRVVISLGLVALVGVLLGYSQVTTLTQLYLLQALLGFAYACIHVVVLMIVVSRWLGVDDPRRGIAIGICVSGASCGAALTAQLSSGLLAHIPWRHAFPVLAFLPVLVLPLVWLVIRPPADANRDSWLVSRDGALGFSWQLFAQRKSLMLMIALVPVFYVSACDASHVVLMLRDRGLSTTVAAGAVSLIFSLGLVGKFGSGFLLLRLSLDRAWLLMMSCMLVGSLLLAVFPEQAYLPGLALVGLGWGGCFPLAQLKISAVYPGPALAQVLGLFVFFESFGSAGGAWFTGLMYDRFGGYSVPFALNCALLAAGIVASLAEAHMRLRHRGNSIQTST